MLIRVTRFASLNVQFQNSVSPFELSDGFADFLCVAVSIFSQSAADVEAE